jgi:hypothetical protein
MKTKDLIELIQEFDPTGELEITVDNCPIVDLVIEPSYWDGYQMVLDYDNPEYPEAITGWHYQTKNNKINIDYMTPRNLLYNKKMVVNYDGLHETTKKYKQEHHQEIREEIARIEYKVYFECFCRYLKKKEYNVSEEDSQKFFDKHFKDRDYPKKYHQQLGRSIQDSRYMWWDDVVWYLEGKLVYKD